MIAFGLACEDPNALDERAENHDRSDGRAAVETTDPAARGEVLPPNVLLITMDTTRADALGIYGQTRATSPNIDRLAQTGVVFEQVAGSNSETLPSHATLFTALHPFEHGVRSNVGYELADRNRTLAEHLAARGYRTGAEVASAVLREKTRIAQGFEHFRGAESEDATLEKRGVGGDAGHEESNFVRTGSDISMRGVEFIRAHRGEPFFLWLHYFEPHSPYHPPERFRARIPDSAYHAEVAALDFQIGLVLRELERLGLTQRTIIVLTADHGEGLGQHDEPTHSFLVYDTTVRIPLVLSGWKDLPKGIRIPSLVREVDIAPTIVDLLGLPALDGVHGVSLESLISGRETDLSLTAYGEATSFQRTFEVPPLRYLRTGRWKYIHKVNPELFDIENDPGEEHNLATRHPEIAERMRGELIRFVDQRIRRDDETVAVDRDTAEQLEALGYAAVGGSAIEAIRDDPESLALEGPDPNSLLEDVRTIAVSKGLLEAGAFVETLRQIEPLWKKTPDNIYVQDIVRGALIGAGRHAEAIPLLEIAVARSPEDTNLLIDHANALGEAGRIPAAVERLEESLEAAPCDAARVSTLERWLRVQRDHAALVSLLEASTTNCPDDDGLRNNYAWALATLPEGALRDGEKSERVIRRAMEHSGREDFAFLDTLAAALAEQGRFDEAIAVQQRAIAQISNPSASAAGSSVSPATAAPVPKEVLSQIRDHLEKYRGKQPLRDPMD
jgi:arylsulfatase A-like enzyme/Flp pilus assembly protein TadD